MIRALGPAIGVCMLLACASRPFPTPGSEIQRIKALLDSIDREQDAHFDDILKSAILISSEVNCPMPIFTPDPARAFRMPIVTPDSSDPTRMPTERAGCRNPLFMPRRDSVHVPPNKRLKLTARVDL